MFTKSHNGSCRSAGIIRRIRKERKGIAEEKAWRNELSVVLPDDYDGDENVTYRNVLNDEIPYARIAIRGKVTSKDKIRARLKISDARITEHQEVIRECKQKLNSMGVKFR